MSDGAVIDVRGISKSFDGRRVVDQVDMQIKRGEIVGFLGPNGSGKTTTLRMMCGLLTPDSGTGRVLGYDVTRAAQAIKLRIGYMTQKFSFYEDLSVAENLHFVGRLYALKNRRAKVDATLERFGLKARRDQMAGTLSGGWKQRMALAACILHDPEVLMLDEPTAGVDPQARRDFWDQIHRLAAEGLTVLVSTHYMDEAERCGRIVYISGGRVIAKGTVPEVIAQSGLVTWIARGEDLMRLAAELRGRAGIAQVAPFGESLHVIGTDAGALEAAIAPFRERAQWVQGETTLEDVFIQLMAQSAQAPKVQEGA
ncbi:MAG: ABC transporter ATP-binding protein [Rhodospirillales bacterium]|nr:ABC transporter ATP-binding protein [Alphaproteobacteria bacterium]MCB9986438.1 ABC transporter ATP-binding protein [Rhodospirillales bacterium]USO07016.1 MAG: ABC transporter ATP-binding protein [Rhodospirillales bacterium]